MVIPMHGEFRHMSEHAQLARNLGVSSLAVAMSVVSLSECMMVLVSSALGRKLTDRVWPPLVAYALTD
jgi:mRNA degradation ribonuclease J1/J2